MALDVQALGAEVDAGGLRRGAGHRDRRRDVLALARGNRRLQLLFHRTGECRELRRSPAGRRAGGARSGARRRSGSRRGSAPRRARRSRARSSRRRCRSRAAAPGRRARAGRAQVGQPRLLVAVERCGRRGRSACATASRELRAVGRVAHRRGHHGDSALGAVRRDRLARTARAPRTRAAAARRRARPLASTPSPSRVTIERRSTSSGGPSASTSAISSRVEFVPMSTTATRVSWPGAASARRPARRAGCRRRSRSSCGASGRSPSRRGGRRAGSAPRAAGGRRAAARGR